MQRKSQRVDPPASSAAGTAAARPATAAPVAPAVGASVVQTQVLVPRQEPSFWKRLSDLALRLHAARSPLAAALVAVNEGRLLLDGDRLSLLLRRGRRYEVFAVSAQEEFDPRSQAARQLGRLGAAAARLDEPLWWHAGAAQDLPPQLAREISEYAGGATRSIGILPLRDDADAPRSGRRHPPCGLLVLERFRDSPQPRQLEQQAAALAPHVSTAIRQALERDGIPMLPLLRALGGLFDRRALPRKLLAVALLAALGAVLMMPVQFRLEARGVLQPVVRREVFAPLEGVVAEVHVDHGDAVAAGARISDGEHAKPLVLLRNLELEMAHTRAAGQKAEALKEANAIAVSLLNDKGLSAAQLDQLRSRKKQLEETIASLDAQLDLLRQKLDLLHVVSPIDGRISTLDLQRRLHQLPVERGQPLFAVSDPEGPWELDLRLPEDRMGHLHQAMRELGRENLAVAFRLSSAPGSEFQGAISRIGDRAELTVENQNAVQIHVAIAKDDLPHLREGAGVVARIDCGKRALGFVIFHDVIEFVQRKLFW